MNGAQNGSSRHGLNSSRGRDLQSDPATWNRASLSSHPVDLLEPETETPSAYRDASLSYLRVMFVIDTYMASARDGVRAWIVVSIVCGMPSTRGKTLTQIAMEIGITKQALSRSVTHLSRMLLIEPAFGLKSIAARKTYQTCHLKSC